MAPENPGRLRSAFLIAEMTRPKAKAKRDQQLNFSLTAEELTTLRSRAAAAGMHLVDYGRAMLFGAPVAAPGVSEQHVTALRIKQLWLAQLSRAGNNLNQIARHLHAFREPAPPSLEPLLVEVRQLINADQSGDR